MQIIDGVAYFHWAWVIGSILFSGMAGVLFMAVLQVGRNRRDSW